MKTSVVNVAGETRYYGFLPPHGRRMANNEEVIFDGDLRSRIAGGNSRHSRSRELTALEAACVAGDICLTEQVEECCSSSSA